ncbi:MAG: hypothetical protein MZV65_44275 [Chromatiales bacterium]|nr:hypothetical protein [Chromatiales bacterium]
MTGGVADGDRARRRRRQVRLLARRPIPGAWLTFLGAWVTMMLGSIPQQDVFQRITSAKNAADRDRAARCSAASIYFCFAFVPMFIAYAATLVDPKLFGELLEKDSAAASCPTLVIQHMPLFAQVHVLRRACCRPS